jgi:23S rRNA (adenine2030-N6)-methyltransferase
VLLALLRRLQAEAGPLAVLDTHAGAGIYDLEGESARRSREGEAVVRLMADAAAPPVFGALKAAIRTANPDGGTRVYPGSPVLTAAALREGDAYTGCELREDDHARLAAALTPYGRRARAIRRDGYAVLAAPTPPARRLVLIDPPFERGDEYPRLVAAVGEALARGGRDVFLIWLPLKDLETFDGFLRGLEAHGLPPTVAMEVRLRPLHDPTRLNGCALVQVGGPDIAAEGEAACRWIVACLGDAGGQARITRLGGE